MKQISVIGALLVLILVVSPALGGKGGKNPAVYWDVTVGDGTCDPQYEGNVLSGSASDAAGGACSNKSPNGFAVNPWKDCNDAVQGTTASYTIWGEDTLDPSDDITLTTASLHFTVEAGAITAMKAYFQDEIPCPPSGPEPGCGPLTHIRDRNRFETTTKLFESPLAFNIDCESPGYVYVVCEEEVPGYCFSLPIIRSKGAPDHVGEVYFGSPDVNFGFILMILEP